MPKKVCPICRRGYIKWAGQRRKFGRVILRRYVCENCGTIYHDLEADRWGRGKGP